MTHYWHVTMTDIFGGQANYCWVREYVFADTGQNDRAIVREAKALTGLTGWPAVTYNHGDSFEIRPRGLCQVVFVEHREGELEESP